MQKKSSKCEMKGFNTQPPEGGWFGSVFGWVNPLLFQHTAA